MTYEHEQTGQEIADRTDASLRERSREKAEEPEVIDDLRKQLAVGFLPNHVLDRRSSIEESVEFVRSFFPEWKASRASLMRSGEIDDYHEVHAKAYEAITWSDLIGHASYMFTESTTAAQANPVGSPRWKKEGNLADRWSRAMEITTKASRPIPPEPRVP